MVGTGTDRTTSKPGHSGGDTILIPGSGVNSGRSSQKWQEIMHLRQASLQQSIHSHDPRPLAVSYPKVGVVLAGGLFSECHAPYLATSVIPGGGGLGDYPTG